MIWLHIKKRGAYIKESTNLTKDYDHLIVGVPVYAAKVPAFAQEIFKDIDGNNKKTTAVVVYGNNEFGKSLKGLVSQLQNQHFNVVAAGSFIGEHSYSGDPIVAKNRPDSDDITKAIVFGKTLGDSLGRLNMDKVPSEFSLFSSMKTEMAIKPTFNSSNCINCGSCSDVCPTGHVDSSSEICLGCLACVKTCTHKGRLFTVNVMQKVMGRMVLSKASKHRREPLTVTNPL